MKCSTLECHSTAVVYSKTSGNNKCIQCGIKIMKQHGPNSVIPLADFKMPWEDNNQKVCPSCKARYSMYLQGHGGECPKCRKDIEHA